MNYFYFLNDFFDKKLKHIHTKGIKSRYFTVKNTFSDNVIFVIIRNKSLSFIWLM
jgi:hypothetical protein